MLNLSCLLSRGTLIAFKLRQQREAERQSKAKTTTD